MKKYDKVYVTGYDGSNVGAMLIATSRTDHMGLVTISKSIPNTPLQEHKNMIVVTVEELSRLWNAGHSAGMEDAGATLKKPAVDFEAYMQSNGITI